MVIWRFALVALMFCIGASGSDSDPPSKEEFNLFCRIIKKANDMMYGSEYVYDERKDMEVVKEMEVFYNATTENINDLLKTLWDMKDFLKEHPPPMQLENRKQAHREIKYLIIDGEKKILENREIALEVNKKIKEAKLSVAQGMYGETVTQVPKEDGNFTDILSNTDSIFENNTTAKESCGHKGETSVGKTLINDIFCLCVGEGKDDGTSEAPCHKNILPPKKNRNNGGWTTMRHTSDRNNAISTAESFEKIEKVCLSLLKGKEQAKDMPALLEEFLEMIGKGSTKNNGNKIFGHSGRRIKNNGNNVTECTGAGTTGDGGQPDYHNDKICVDYTNNFKEGKNYKILWHNKFKNYYTFMDEAKIIEDKILKNHAEILLLKSKAWIAYNREKEDHTANLDDMNESQLFDGAQLTHIIPFPFIFFI
ncbi:Variant surface glycoprotein [Trypanosoma congolense IL3000]|uniref:Variant surface glycoprotein n=1 Tax=Trypanosoma congolense (strain IL3000) TaxID=1068625 RepID=F9WAI3_TRYCI|nr:Variant surface glycoprotein [Trypanosoma congolense IL3000]